MTNSKRAGRRHQMPGVVFVNDQPTDVDLFDSKKHQKIADSIFDLVDRDYRNEEKHPVRRDYVNLIALHGECGSGKSSVVKMLMKKYVNACEKTPFLSYAIDWVKGNLSVLGIKLKNRLKKNGKVITYDACKHNGENHRKEILREMYYSVPFPPDLGVLILAFLFSYIPLLAVSLTLAYVLANGLSPFGIISFPILVAFLCLFLSLKLFEGTDKRLQDNQSAKGRLLKEIERIDSTEKSKRLPDAVIIGLIGGASIAFSMISFLAVTTEHVFFQSLQNNLLASGVFSGALALIAFLLKDSKQEPIVAPMQKYADIFREIVGQIKKNYEKAIIVIEGLDEIEEKQASKIVSFIQAFSAQSIDSNSEGMDELDNLGGIWFLVTTCKTPPRTYDGDVAPDDEVHNPASNCIAKLDVQHRYAIPHHPDEVTSFLKRSLGKAFNFEYNDLTEESKYPLSDVDNTLRILESTSRTSKGRVREYVLLIGKMCTLTLENPGIRLEENAKRAISDYSFKDYNYCKDNPI